ncbi:heavy metal translocatin [Hortaea werneckii]|nr:heavy metal translocatin [Hortaea werneckii]KAI7307022.1 heavy metal translocatin [Hortaea werneckii]
MEKSSDPTAPVVILQTSFLVSNLNCPTCVSHITSLMNGFTPAPVIRDISIINHVVTIAHENTLPAVSISEALTSAGYEVFDTSSASGSCEKLLAQADREANLVSTVQRWDSRRNSQLDRSTRQMHDANCQVCAACSNTARGRETLESVAISNAVDATPLYLAILSIDGMTCSSCVGNVTKTLQDVRTVDRVDVSLVGRSANVQLRTDEVESVTCDLIQAVEDAGYDAELMELTPVLATAGKKEDEDKNDFWRATYAIEGMSCSSCVGKISSIIKNFPFVERAEVNLVAHAGSVTFCGKNNEALVLNAINEASYKAVLVVVEPIAKRDVPSSRTISLQIHGMHCPQCPKRVSETALGLQADIQKPPTLESPTLTISYIPDAPKLTVRRIIDELSALDNSFTVGIHKAISVEQRSREMLMKEQRAILLRVILSVLAAIPSLIIGVVYMNLVSKHDPGYMYLMYPLHGVSRAEWANFIMATPVYFFAADHFHRRMLKEVYALWRPRSSVPIKKRLYRFGSMNMLISLGTTIAYFSSFAELIVAASDPSKDMIESSKQSYFDSVVFLTMFLLLGRLAEARMKAKSGDAISALGKLRPAEASLVVQDDRDGTFSVERVSVDLIDTGDLVKIPHGSSPPCDGTLLEESADFDESSLTGESRVIAKQKGDAIFSGTINKGQAITIRVTSPTGASMLDSIIQIVREGQSKRAPVERIADILTAYFVPVVVFLAITTWIIWLSLGLSGTLPLSYLDNSIGGWPFWSLQFAIAVFVIACPCGLGLAAPTALFVGGGLAAKRGILVKGGGEALQEASNLDAVVFDKTGTLTEGAEPKIVQHKLFTDGTGLEKSTIFGTLKGVEENSSHPLARAAVNFATSQGAAEVRINAIEEIAGKGLKAMVEPVHYDVGGRYEAVVGNEALLLDYGVQMPQEAIEFLDSWKVSGHSVMLLACRISGEKWRLAAILAASDTLRPEAAEVVRLLQNRGVDVWMLSGDNSETANAVGSHVGIPPSNIIAGVLPAQKADKVRYLQQSLEPRRGGGFQSALANKRSRATIAMVGDGINDAPALAAADVGIAVASGSDVAVQSAAFVLVQSDLRAVLTLVNLSRVVLRRVILNFFWAALYNMIALPVAAGVLYPIQTSGGSGVRLDPAWAALAMALSSISVVASSLLLRTRIPGIGFREQFATQKLA